MNSFQSINEFSYFRNLYLKGLIDATQFRSEVRKITKTFEIPVIREKYINYCEEVINNKKMIDDK